MARSPSPWLELIEAAIATHLGDETPPANVRKLVDRERARLRQSTGPRSRRRGSSSGSTSGPSSDALGSNPDPEVFTALKAWRSKAARAANVPAYVIFHDTTLAAVAEARPTSRAALLDIPGLGPVKADRYGEALLQVVAESGHSA